MVGRYYAFSSYGLGWDGEVGGMGGGQNPRAETTLSLRHCSNMAR